MPDKYNPTFNGFSEQNRYIPAEQVSGIVAAMESKALLDFDFENKKIRLYKDTENNIYSVLPDAVLGEGSFGVVLVCQNIQTGKVYVVKVLKGENASGLKDEVELANALADAKLYPEKSFISMQFKTDSKGVPEGDRATLDSVAIFPLLSGTTWSKEYLTAIPELEPKSNAGVVEKENKIDNQTDLDLEAQIDKRQANRTNSFVVVEITDEERAVADANIRKLDLKIQEIKKFQPIPTSFDGEITDGQLITLVDNIKRAYAQNQRKFAKHKTSDKEMREFMSEEQEKKVNYLSNVADVDILKIIRDVSSGLLYSASALSDLHKIGILHCDVKPENIILSKEDKRAFLCDLGTVMTKESGELKIKDEMLYKETTCPLAVGSPAYLAPEIYENYQIAQIAQSLFIDQAKLKWHIDKRRKPGEIVKVSPATTGKRVKLQGSDIEISDSSSVEQILGLETGKYIEPHASIYSEKSDAYSLGASAAYVLSHMLEKLKIGERKVTEQDEMRANALLPEEFLNPENNQTIQLANDLLVLIHGLMAVDPAQRLSLTEAKERLVALEKIIEDRIDEGTKKNHIEDEGLDYSSSISTNERERTNSLEPIFQVLDDNYTVKPKVWDAIKADIADKVTTINDKYAHARGTADTHYRDTRSFIYSESQNTIELTENVTNGFPLDKLTIKNNTNTLTVSIPLSWSRNNAINIPLREEMLIGVLESIKKQAVGSKVVIGNCAGRPEMAKAMYKLALESGMQPVYSKDGSDPRNVIERMFDKGVKSRWNPK